MYINNKNGELTKRYQILILVQARGGNSMALWSKTLHAHFQFTKFRFLSENF